MHGFFLTEKKMIRIKTVVFFVMFFTFCQLSFSQDFENTRFTLISTQHGLSQKTVQTIYQDKTGFMWFGTQEGLNRYDGKETRVYRYSAGNEFSVSHDVIRSINEDSNGQLWVATSGGLSRYLPGEDSFVRVKVYDNEEEVLRFNTLYLDNSGVMWIGSDGNGVYQLSNESDNQIEKYTQLDALNQSDVRAIFEDSRGRIWVGTDGQGVFLISNNQVQHFEPKEQKGALSNARIRTVEEDSKGRIWIGTRGGGINRYDELSKSFTVLKNIEGNKASLSHNRVYQIFEDSNDRLWIATDGGISLYDQSDDSFTQITHKSSQNSSLSHNRVLSIYEDKGGLLWFGTLSGLNLWDSKLATFSHYRNIPEDKNSLSNNTVYSLAETKSEDILIGTVGGGLNLLKPEKNTVHPFDSRNSDISTQKRVVSLLVDDDDNVWVGSISKGVKVYSSKLELLFEFDSEQDEQRKISANGITDILQDSDGDIWVATYRSGINHINKEYNVIKQYNLATNKSNLVSENIYSIIEDDEGFIWLATDGGGLSRLDKNTGSIITILNDAKNNKSLSGNIISSIYQDSKGRFWIGTQGNGLNMWAAVDRRKMNNKFRHYAIEDGLNSSTINGVVEDESGYIWISTVKGLNRLNPESNKIERYNTSDELHFNELNQGAILKSSNGDLYFGGLNGVTAFDPEKIRRNKHIPEVVLTNIFSESNALDLDKASFELDEIDLNHKDYLIAFEFAALDYANPDKNQYQYMLEGFDEDWISAGTRSRATFTNLPSGQYIFKVKGSNNDGIWSDESINLKVAVHPAPWFSWWAYSLYATLFCIILLIFIRHQAKRFAKHDLFQNQVNEKVDEKIQLYMQNNETLTKKVEKLDALSLVDHETQLLSQSAFISHLSTALDVQNALVTEDNRNESRLLIGLLDVEVESAVNHAQCLVKVAEQLKLKSQDNLIIARWDESQLALLMPIVIPLEGQSHNLSDDVYQRSEKGTQISIESVAKDTLDKLITCTSGTDSLKATHLKLGVTLPKFALDGQTSDSELLLLLTEHMMYSAKQFTENTFIAIYETRKKLTNRLVKSILSEKQPLKLTDGIVFMSNQNEPGNAKS
jgi:ligand-binding sensor domain-containing protein/GGDEF domain-containing protein